MPTIATAVQAVPASGIRRIFELALELEDVIQLSIGEPQLPVARHILNAGAGPGTTMSRTTRPTVA
jgi:aspartate/methionine/tyrosine aminotransferase